MQILTFLILQCDTIPLRGAGDTAVHLRHLKWGLSLLLLIFTIPPHVLIWRRYRVNGGVNDTKIQKELCTFTHISTLTVNQGFLPLTDI